MLFSDGSHENETNEQALPERSEVTLGEVGGRVGVDVDWFGVEMMKTKGAQV